MFLLCISDVRPATSAGGWDGGPVHHLSIDLRLCFRNQLEESVGG